MTDHPTPRVVQINHGVEDAAEDHSTRRSTPGWVAGSTRATRSTTMGAPKNVVVSSLVASGHIWTYQSDTTRSTVEFSDDNHVQTVLHERTDDGTTYKPSMKVTLVKVD